MGELSLDVYEATHIVEYPNNQLYIDYMGFKDG
jgi:hypothetical protein